MSAFESALFPAFVKPGERCERCFRQKEMKIELISRNTRSNTIAFLQAELCAVCYSTLRSFFPDSITSEVVP